MDKNRFLISLKTAVILDSWSDIGNSSTGHLSGEGYYAGTGQKFYHMWTELKIKGRSPGPTLINGFAKS